MDIKEHENKNRIGSQSWVNSENKNFEEIVNENILLYKNWAHSKYILDTKYQNNILKPINPYAMYFHKKPELINENDLIKLRYRTHAEIWLEPKKNGLYALDKTWQRQFYPSNIKVDHVPQEYFNAVYRFYIPWIFDLDIKLKIIEVEGSPFKILNSYAVFNKLDKDRDIWNTDWFHFLIKNSGDHIESYNGDVYGVIEIGSPICDIIIENKDLIKKIKEEYGQEDNL